MPMAGDKYDFTDKNIDNAPDEAGVYALYDGNMCIYYGRAMGVSVTIRSRLRDHKAGREGSCTSDASHFMQEVAPNPSARERELLAEYVKNFRELPVCNDRIA